MEISDPLFRAMVDANMPLELTGEFPIDPPRPEFPEDFPFRAFMILLRDLAVYMQGDPEFYLSDYTNTKEFITWVESWLESE